MLKRLSLFLAAAALVLVGSLQLVSAEDKGDELVIVFQKQKDPAKIREEANRVADYLSKELGMKVTAQVPSDYSASVQALVSKKADIAYVDSMAYLLAKRDGDASMLLVEQRPDGSGKLRTEYDSIFVVRKDSELKSVEDLKSKSKDLRMVFTSPTSTSGYIMAYRRFVQEGMLKPKADVSSIFKSVSFGGGYVQALEQVLNGRGDVAAVSFYTLEGPSAAKYLPEEQRSQLRVLGRTPGVPTHAIVARGGLSAEMKQRVSAAMLSLSKNKPELLSDVYGTSQFTTANPDEHVRAAIEAVEYTGLPLKGIVKKSISPSEINGA